MAFVLDASVAAAWMLPDEGNEFADELILRLHSAPGLVPSLFWFEARNLFMMAERRRRIAAGEAIMMMARLKRLPLEDAGGGSDLAVLELPASIVSRPTTRAIWLSLSIAICRWQLSTNDWPRSPGPRTWSCSGEPVHAREGGSIHLRNATSQLTRERIAAVARGWLICCARLSPE